MAGSSGSDKGRRARYGVMWFCWFCGLQPKFSVDSPEHESQPQPTLAVASASTSASVAASASASAPVAACRLMINPNRFRSEVGRGKYGTVFEGYVKSFDEQKEGHIRGLWFGDSLVGPIEKWTKVALKVVNEEGMKVISSWLSEVRSLGNLDSPFFVKLITVTEFLSSLEEKVTVLVYDFMPNGSLKDCLIKKDSPCPLTWRLREKIALFAAEGLLYLHERKMIYGDFKASNILLNKYFTPQLAFFGLSRSREDNTNFFATLLEKEESFGECFQELEG